MRLIRKLREAERGRSGRLSELFGFEINDQLVETWGYFYESGGDTVFHLDLIRVKRNAPPGLGSSVLSMLCDEANKKGFLITLTPGDQSYGKEWKATTSVARLTRWYKRFTFVRKSSVGRDGLYGYLVRFPVGYHKTRS